MDEQTKQYSPIIISCIILFVYVVFNAPSVADTMFDILHPSITVVTLFVIFTIENCSQHCIKWSKLNLNPIGFLSVILALIVVSHPSSIVQFDPCERHIYGYNKCLLLSDYKYFKVMNVYSILFCLRLCVILVGNAVVFCRQQNDVPPVYPESWIFKLKKNYCWYNKTCLHNQKKESNQIIYSRLASYFMRRDLRRVNTNNSPSFGPHVVFPL